MSYIKVNNLSKDIKNNLVLKNINLDLEKGKIYGFIGANGSGKTMLFRAICGLIKPTEGQVYIDDKLMGKDIMFPKSCGVIIENPGLWENYSAFENLKTLAKIKNIINDDEIRKTIKAVGLNPDDNRPIRKYSLGMKQKLAIAQAIMEKPDLIVLDEPTNALDDESVINIRNILKEQKEKGATILIASHNKEDIYTLADKTFKLNMGSLSAC